VSGQVPGAVGGEDVGRAIVQHGGIEQVRAGEPGVGRGNRLRPRIGLDRCGCSAYTAIGECVGLVHDKLSIDGEGHAASATGSARLQRLMRSICGQVVFVCGNITVRIGHSQDPVRCPARLQRPMCSICGQVVGEGPGADGVGHTSLASEGVVGGGDVRIVEVVDEGEASGTVVGVVGGFGVGALFGRSALEAAVSLRSAGVGAGDEAALNGRVSATKPHV